MPVTIESTRLRATISLQDDAVLVRLIDPKSGHVWADGPYLYSVRCNGVPASGVLGAKLQATSDSVAISGSICGTPVGVTHRFSVSAEQGIDETIQLRNLGSDAVHLNEIAFGLRRPLATSDTLRLVACPFRRQADAKLHDYSVEDLLAGRCSNSDGHNDEAVTDNRVCDSDVMRSEAWVLVDTSASLLVAKYNPEHIECSVSAVEQTTQGAALRFAGAGLSLFREPRAATLLAPGRCFEFGPTRLQPVDGGWEAAYDAYRSFLNAKGHGMPPGYAPPLNWNELFDVGWYHSNAEELAKHYTREALMAEAAKAKEVGCDVLYLDPGWEECEGTTLWDEKRLGKVADFSREIHERFGLKLAYRTIGRVYRDEFPKSWYLKRENTSGSYEQPWLKPPVRPEPAPLTKPDGRRNLCLLESTTATASSLIPDYPDVHRVDHLIDGWYGNCASWVSAGDPSWIQVDFATSHTISEIALGSEHTPSFKDRAITAFNLLVSTAETSSVQDWHKVFSYEGEPIRETRTFTFAQAPARRVRLEIRSAVGGAARIDEFEVYEAAPSEAGGAPRRRPEPKGSAGTSINFWEVCTESPDWQREKLKRILAVTKGGVDFMMFDEFDWRGACYDPSHGHPVPSTPEGHVKAVYGLVEQMRKEHPHVLVEAHDPVWPWSCRYLPTYFRQGFAGNRYQENWGFEFMWHPIEDLKSGRAMCLYYYNLGCDIPLYDHITMESDNDACLSFWWYASTVRHLGIGGKKGLDSRTENEGRWQQYKKAVAEYNRLRPFYSRGRFVGIDETAHLHIHPTDRAAVLNVYNLTDKPQKREVRIDTVKAGLGAPDELKVTGSQSTVEGPNLVLTFNLPPESPALAELQASGGS